MPQPQWVLSVGLHWCQCWRCLSSVDSRYECGVAVVLQSQFTTSSSVDSVVSRAMLVAAMKSSYCVRRSIKVSFCGVGSLCSH